MEIARIKVNGVSAHVVYCKPIPAGLTGATVALEYTDPQWKGLSKTVVFRGVETKDVVNAGSSVTLPHEVVSRAGAAVRVGVYGVDGENNLIIPTLWADLGIVVPGVEPSGDESTAPTPAVWEQILSLVGNMEALSTQAKSSLVAAINELADEAGGADPEKIGRLVTEYLAKHPLHETDPTVPAWAKEPRKPGYMASEVGAEPAGTAVNLVAAHNVSTTSHNDIRQWMKAMEALAANLLPDVTVEDNGKLLQVVGGQWQMLAVADSAVASFVDNYINEALGGDY